MNVALRPGLCSVTFRALSPPEVIALAKSVGLEGIEWGGDVHVPPGDLALARRIGEATRAAGLSVASYGSYVRPPTDGSAEFAAALDTAIALGASTIRVWPGERGRASATYAPGERDAVAGLIREFCAAAEARGISVSLEYHPGSLTDDLSSACALLASASAPNLHTYWQPRPGLPIKTAIKEVGALSLDLSHLHVFAWDDGSKRYPLRTAEPLWRAALDVLRPSRWKGDRFALLEFVRDDKPAALHDDAETLRRWLARAGER